VVVEESTGMCAQRTAETNRQHDESPQSSTGSGNTPTSTTDLDNMELDGVSAGLRRYCKQKPDAVTHQGCTLCAQHCAEFTMMSLAEMGTAWWEDSVAQHAVTLVVIPLKP